MIRNALFGFLGLTTAILVLAAISLPAHAVDNIVSSDTPDLTSVRGKIKSQDYAGALKELRSLAEDNQQADVYNLLGYTLRKTGDFETALSYYARALELQPNHKAAREYLGELYVETGKMDKANEQLASLTKLCPNGCDERDDLQKFIAANSNNRPKAERPD